MDSATVFQRSWRSLPRRSKLTEAIGSDARLGFSHCLPLGRSLAMGESLLSAIESMERTWNFQRPQRFLGWEVFGVWGCPLIGEGECPRYRGLGLSPPESDFRSRERG